MSDANRIHVRVQPELTPVRLEDRRMDVNAEIKVQVEHKLSPLGVTGLAVLALALLSVAVGCIQFAVGYPEEWYARFDPGGSGYEDSRAFIERTVLFWGAGVIGLFLGTSMFFHGRTVLGSGSLDRVSLQEQRLEEAH